MLKKDFQENNGMTLPELILAIIMLGSFTALFVVVSQFTSKFFQKNLRADIESNVFQKNDILNVQSDLYKSFDYLKLYLSQPGYQNSFFTGQGSTPVCSDDPQKDWKIPSSYQIKVPIENKICIEELIPESPLQDFVKDSFKPGIYILYSLPKIENEELTFNKIPVRTIFCRPRPFCTTS